MSNIVYKSPGADLDYGFDWTADDWLPEGDTISASAWSVSPSGLTIGTTSSTTTTTTAWLSGGEAGQWYMVKNHVTSTGGRQDDRTLFVKVRQR